MRICASLHRTLAILVVASAPIAPATAQTASIGNQTSTLVEMLSGIRNAVDAGRHRDVAAVYKVVSLRLASCAITYRVLSENTKSTEQARADHLALSNIYFRAASAVYPENALSFEQELPKLQDKLLDVRSDRKRLFYFLRNCRDLSTPDSVQGAISELLL